MFGWYFHDYVTPPWQAPLLEVLRDHPIDIVKFILVYMGAPTFAMLGGSTHLWPVATTGCAIVGLTLALIVVAVRERNYAELFLLSFVTYVVATASLTSLGRLGAGPEAALQSRYSTPAFLAWAALVILAGSRFSLGNVAYVALIIPLLLLPAQLRALEYDHDLNFEKMVAALALELVVNDDTQLTYVHPIPAIVLAQTEYPRKFDYSIFANPLIHNVNELVGQSVSEPSCIGQIVSETKLRDDAKFVRVEGTLSQAGPKRVILTSPEGKATGYALTKGVRFKGYMLAGATAIEFRDKSCADAKSAF
jgi:hypothetical protein